MYKQRYWSSLCTQMANSNTTFTSHT